MIRQTYEQFLDFVEHPERASEMSRFPTFCLILYTDAPGLDAEVRTVLDNPLVWDELDELTGRDGVVITLLETRQSHNHWAMAPYTDSVIPVREVVRVADMLGVQADEIPAAVFFTDVHARDAVVLPFALAFGARQIASESAVQFLFRPMVQVMRRAAAVNDPRERLELIERTLRRRFGTGDRPTARLDRALDRGSKATTIGQALARAFARVITG